MPILDEQAFERSEKGQEGMEKWDWTKWLLEKTGVDEIDIGRTVYFTKLVLTKWDLTKWVLAKYVLDEMTIWRSGQTLVMDEAGIDVQTIDHIQAKSQKVKQKKKKKKAKKKKKKVKKKINK